MATEEYPKIYIYKRIVQAKRFIDNHFAEDIDLDNISDEAYFSKFHFIRLFKKVYGKTPHHYLRQVRINIAKQLLAEDRPVTEVSISVGFDSATSFAGVFKNLVGVSPSQFQKEQLQRKLQMECTPLRFVPNCFAETYGWK